MLDSHRPTGLCLPGFVFSGTRLNAGFLVRTEDELVWAKFTALLDALVRVQDSPGFLLEVRISGKDSSSGVARDGWRPR
jgi:hypothetical protein